MNKLLLTLCVSLITALAADDESNIAQLQKRSWANNEAGSAQECPAPKPCCKEKCCPCPKPPVCCECYVPSYYDLQCDSGVFFYGDFLYWYANEDNLAPCATVVGTAFLNNPSFPIPSSVLAPTKVNHLGTKWDPGFRAALGYNFDHDGWDVEVNYTWYVNKKHRTFSVPGFGSANANFSFLAQGFPTAGQQALVDPWINTAVFNTQGIPFLFDTVNARWKLNFNQIDFELGRKFWLGKYTAMRTYAGARGAWFTTRFNNAASANYNFLTNFTFTKFSDNFKDRVWGAGILVGMQPEWHFCQNFILFSNLDAALLWGKFKVRKKEDYNSFTATRVQTINYHNVLTDNFFKMQAVLDLAIGLRWEETWCYRIRTALDVGWEHHIWFDDNHRFKNNSIFSNANGGFLDSNGFQGFSEEAGNLMMGGAVVRFRVDF